MSLSTVIGVWAGAGSQSLLRWIQRGDQDPVTVLRLTLRRATLPGVPSVVLLPWDESLDHMEREVRSWGSWLRLERCHPDERVAMRDLVAHYRADTGILVDGAAAMVDASELKLALARLGQSFGAYHSPRVKARLAKDWLTVSDTDEWPPLMSPEELQKFYANGALDDEARAIHYRLNKGRIETSKTTGMNP